jgi:hypothetical protein
MLVGNHLSYEELPDQLPMGGLRGYEDVRAAVCHRNRDIGEGSRQASHL